MQANNNFSALFEQIEKVQKNKTKLYSVKVLEKYNALTVKKQGLEKLAKTFANYKPKTEKEKAYIEYITSTKYYGTGTSDIQKYIIELLNA